MKRFVFLALITLALSHWLPGPSVAEAGIDINIHAGLPFPSPPPLPPAPRVVISSPPLFLTPPTLGFQVAVDVPYDLFCIGGRYYLYDGGRWYRSSYYRGPWIATGPREIPPGLRRHRFEQIRHLRDEEYDRYRDDEAHYRGRRFRPEGDWREERREEHERWKEEKHREKEERKRWKHRHDDD